MRIEILLLLLAFACTPKMAPPTVLTVEGVAKIFASSTVKQDGKNFDVTTGTHTFSVLHNGQGEYRVYEMLTDPQFGEHYEPTALAKSYEAIINEKRK